MYTVVVIINKRLGASCVETDCILVRSNTKFDFSICRLRVLSLSLNKKIDHCKAILKYKMHLLQFKY